ncbi:MAG: hypothetical protein FWF59_02115, partial [Turicibacter sp.]|nr:hypothetical protein [Turicibacter sp.]
KKQIGNDCALVRRTKSRGISPKTGKFTPQNWDRLTKLHEPLWQGFRFRLSSNSLTKECRFSIKLAQKMFIPVRPYGMII